MRAPRRLYALTLLLTTASSIALAAVTVNPPLPIEHVVRVRLILAAEDDGGGVATALGTGSTRAYIEQQIDRVWAQAGIDVWFDPIEPTYASTFALVGDGTGGTRPSAHFNPVLDGAAAAGLTSPDPLTLNLVLVDHVPGFPVLSENAVGGRARVGRNGIVGFVGENLLGFSSGRDAVAGVMAHEIGHNLGLNHTADGQANLMSPSGTTDQLSSSQIAQVLTNQFVVPLTPPPGDYTGDLVVDAADYAAWRDGSAGSYNEWAANYGAAGAGATAIPEPMAMTLVVSTAIAGAGLRRRR